jgi:phosphoserine phosphatase
MRGSMQLALTLVGLERDALDSGQSKILVALKDVRARVKEPRPLGEAAADLILNAADLSEVRAAANAAVADIPVDVCVQPLEGRRKRLFVADMDSTIIGCECIDELADFAGKKAEIAAITERAMRGELAFEGALRERVAMLKGLPVSALQAAYDERVRLNPGARTLVRTMAANGTRCVLVSGGFTFFTSRVAEAAGFHAQRANSLGEGEGVLTGLVGEPILGREAKLAALTEEAAGLGLDMTRTIAVGDGANDLAMIKAAGLGVAYRAKPIVAAEADAKVDHADLTALLYFQGYRAEEFVTD